MSAHVPGTLVLSPQRGWHGYVLRELPKIGGVRLYWPGLKLEGVSLVEELYPVCSAPKLAVMARWHRSRAAQRWAHRPCKRAGCSHMRQEHAAFEHGKSAGALGVAKDVPGQFADPDGFAAVGWLAGYEEGWQHREARRLATATTLPRDVLAELARKVAGGAS